MGIVFLKTKEYLIILQGFRIKFRLLASCKTFTTNKKQFINIKLVY
jgi:hypothetical protein